MATKKRTLKRRGSPSKNTVNKATSKALKQTSNKLKKAAAAGRKQAEVNELAYIERILGEDFESLSQARRELKKNISTDKRQITRLQNQLNKDVKKAVTKTLPKSLKKATNKIKQPILTTVRESVADTTKRTLEKLGTIVRPSKLTQPHIDVTSRQKVYTLQELKDGDRRAIMSYLQDRLNANELTKQLLQPGERIVAQVTYTYKGKNGAVKTGYANTYETYESFYQLFQKLSAYGTKSLKGTKTFNSKSPNKVANWLNQIKIMKWNGSTTPNPQKKGARNQGKRKVVKG